MGDRLTAAELSVLTGTADHSRGDEATSVPAIAPAAQPHHDAAFDAGWPDHPLAPLHHQLAERMAARVAQRIGTACLGRPLDVSFQHGEAFRNSLRHPTFLVGTAVANDTAKVLLEVHLPLAYALIEGMLGNAHVVPYSPRRPLTEIEERLMEGVLNDVLLEFGNLWPESMELTASEVFTANAAAAGRWLPIAEKLWVWPIQLTWGNSIEGQLRIAFPQSLAEKRMGPGILSSPSPDAADKLPADANCKLTVVLAQRAISATDYLHLAEGDVIATGGDAAGWAEVWINGLPAYLGKVGQSQGRKCVEIDWRVTANKRAA